jgi:signal transduction histidine kinase
VSQAPTVKVLLVEDDEDDAVLTRGLLREIEGRTFELEWVKDFEPGLERLCQGVYDVCLVDYRLGERNGVEFIELAMRRECRGPIILLTGQGDHEIDVAAMNAGAADFLNKGQINAGMLERSIRYAIQQRRAEEQRIRLFMEQAARAEAEAANRAKDQFLAVLSHELRTPLTAVLASVDAMNKSCGLSGTATELVDIIRRNVELEARLIDDLLDLTRVSRGKLELHRQPVDVHDELKHAVKMCRQGDAQQKRIDVRLEAGAVHHWVSGDPARLQQVFWNLLKNAIKFTPEGGTVEVRTANAADDAVRVSVSDTGIGIDPEALPKIFNAFEQGDKSITRQFGGLGLGLAITRALVERHGGKISAESEGRYRGATFIVELHAVPAPLTEPEEPAPAELGLAAADVRILLVEDHADTARTMTLLLRSLGYRVTTAGSVASALEAAQSEKFDLLISDVGLPDGTGLDLMQQLLSRGPMRGIVLSGFGMEEDVRRSLEAGFSLHLTKPIDLQRLEAAIERVTPGAAAGS